MPRRLTAAGVAPAVTFGVAALPATAAAAGPPAAAKADPAPSPRSRATSAADKAATSGFHALAKGPSERYDRKQVTPWGNGLCSIAYERTYRGLPATDTIGQTVTIPAGCTKATLRYWLHIDTGESGATAYDTFQVKVNGTAKQTYSNVGAAAGYTERTLDLSQFLGRQITLTFTATEDSSLRTSFVVDDPTLTTS
ncbi:hypothetical protein ACF1A5_19345 [Streptomyces sp. NPDC014864]|uniref:hypothetical protein n=1 Tax=Streptomyces sp. NPDC014864 TaxID=3364924 RepID=UPI0036FCC97B